MWPANRTSHRTRPALHRRIPPPPPPHQAVWAVLFSSFMAAGIIFVLLETDQLGGMFQSDSKCAGKILLSGRNTLPFEAIVIDRSHAIPRSHWLYNLWKAFHFGVRAWTQTGYFEPVRPVAPKPTHRPPPSHPVPT